MSTHSTASADTYTITISWKRLFPNGDKQLDERAWHSYEFLARELARQGKQVVLSFPCDLIPAPLVEAGGWARRATADAYVYFVTAVMERLGSVVDGWLIECAFGEKLMRATACDLYLSPAGMLGTVGAQAAAAYHQTLAAARASIFAQHLTGALPLSVHMPTEGLASVFHGCLAKRQVPRSIVLFTNLRPVDFTVTPDDESDFCSATAIVSQQPQQDTHDNAPYATRLAPALG